MKLIIKHVALLLLGVALLACRKDSETLDLHQSVDAFTLQIEDARKLAKHINLINPYESSSPSSFRHNSYNEITEELIVGDEIPDYYVFNFKNNDGFIILSGDFRMAPVLASSHSGNFPMFGDTISAGLAAYLETYLEYAQSTRDSVMNMPYDMYQLWRSTGTDAAIPNPDEHCDSCDGGDPIDPDDDIGSGSGGGVVPSSSTYGPLLVTEWNQHPIYNYYAPYMDCDDDNGKSLAGCVAVAMAQVVRYWEHPSNTRYKYDQMGAGDNPNLAIATLIDDCGDLVNMDFGCSASSANTADAIRALKNDLGYSSNATYQDFSWSKLESEIKLDRPVILRGCRGTNKILFWIVGENCHAWVADGIRITTSSHTTLREAHMNWGWGDNGGNGFTLGFENIQENRNYQYQRKMGVNIHP